MTPDTLERKGLFATPAFTRLWAVGGIANVMLWFEVLAASLFTFERTGSGWAVALVSAARAVPLLGLGALTGIVADAWNRKSIVLGGLLLSGAAAGSLSALAFFGLVQPLHVALAALVSGSVYATEMPARRRMVAEAAGPARTDEAVALDSLTSFATRSIGPILGGFAYQRLGLEGAFLISALANLLAAAIVLGLDHRQVLRRLAFRQIGPDLWEAFRFAIRAPTILTLLAVTITMNLCGYSYTSLIAPVAKLGFGLDDTRTGLLAAAEPAGAFLGGLVLTRVVLPGYRLAWLMAGVAVLTAALLTAAVAGSLGAGFGSVCAILACGGLGSAVYTVNQTSIVIAEAPAAIRSRVFGLITICIGSWPIGMVLAGALVANLPPLAALAVLSTLGLCLIAIVAVVWNGRTKRSRAAALG